MRKIRDLAVSRLRDFDLAAVYADELRCKLHGEFARAA